MRLLVISARYPTADRPAAGVFVARRLAGVDAVVVAPARYDRPGWLRYLSIAWRAMTARGPFDGVEGHFVLPAGVLALVVARLRGLPLVVHAHGSDVRTDATRGRLRRWLARRVVRGADAVVANSAHTARYVAALGGSARVIPPGVDLERFTPTPRPARRRVLYLGGASPGKGLETARGLADTLVGPGIREVAPDDIPRMLAEHDVLLVPSEAEGFGLAAAEAIAAGRWVVAARAGGLVDVVRDGRDGTLVADGDFAAALRSVPDYDPQAVAAGAGRFSLERQRAALAELWTEVLRRRRAIPPDAAGGR